MSAGDLDDLQVRRGGRDGSRRSWRGERVGRGDDQQQRNPRDREVIDRAELLREGAEVDLIPPARSTGGRRTGEPLVRSVFIHDPQTIGGCRGRGYDGAGGSGGEGFGHHGDRRRRRRRTAFAQRGHLRHRASDRKCFGSQDDHLASGEARSPDTDAIRVDGRLGSEPGDRVAVSVELDTWHRTLAWFTVARAKPEVVVHQRGESLGGERGRVFRQEHFSYRAQAVRHHDPRARLATDPRVQPASQG